MASDSLLLTHTDLDGIGCAVLYAASGNDPASARLVENGAIGGAVREALARGGSILVTDHGVDESTAQAVDRFIAGGGTFTLLDHHRSAGHLGGRSWATIDEGRSATGLLFDFLGRPARLEEFASLVEDHDLWKHSDPRSAKLAALVGLLGHERFLARFAADPRVTFSEGETLLLETEDARREDYLAKKLAQAWTFERGGVLWAVCYAEAYQSDLAEALMTSLGAGATAIVNPAKRTVSLRGRGVDVSELAQRQGGGGHARAAAFTFRGGALELELERFESSLEELLSS